MSEHEPVDKTSPDYLRHLARRSMDIYYESYQEMITVFDFFAGYHWNQEQYNELRAQHIPILYRNIVKTLTNRLSGHFDTIVNTAKVIPQQIEDIPIAEIFNDLVNKDLRDSGFNTNEGKEMLRQTFISGLGVVERMPVKNGKVDIFGRPLHKMSVKTIPAYDVILDETSREQNYSDARHFHRLKWMTEEDMIKNFPDIDLKEVTIGGDSVGSPFNIWNRFDQGVHVVATPMRICIAACTQSLRLVTNATAFGGATTKFLRKRRLHTTV